MTDHAGDTSLSAPKQPCVSRFRKIRRRLIWLLVLDFILANVFAIIQSRAMTQFAGNGVRTRAPEHLSHWQKIKVLFCGVDIPRQVNKS